MRILLAHTYYKQPGGEDRVFLSETALLRQNGHEVLEYCQHNSRTADLGSLTLAARTVWSDSTYKELREILRREKPAVCHFHNTFPLMSPAAFYAAKAEGIPVIATLHNYRLLCPSATLMRQGSVCEDCLATRIPSSAVRHRCYRGSRSASAAAALMLTVHRWMETWTRAVDVWIALTDFARQKFVDGGLPSGKVVVKPNFVTPDPGVSADREDFALFAGRLSVEKGVETLLAVWRAMPIPIRLRIAGDGPLAQQVEEASRLDPRIEWLGPLSRDRLNHQMKRARVLVFPSIWYEGLPLTILEAYATGLPVIASRLGSMESLVEHGRTGLHFEAGNPADLAENLTWSWQNPERLKEMGANARQCFLQNYTAQSNYLRLMQIYEQAIQLAREPALRHQDDRADQRAVIDQVAAAYCAAGSCAAGGGVKAGESISLDDRAVKAAGRVTEKTEALI